VGVDTTIPSSLIQGEAVVQISGRIKWFDSVKGYGFVKPSDATQGDVLLHQSCVRQSGFKLAQEGATVVCEAVERAKGFQAVRVLELDNTTATTATDAAHEARYTAQPMGPHSRRR